MRLFVETQSQTGLKVCRIKNKFLSSDAEAKDGYRDVTLNVLLEAENGLKIIGEIQVCAVFSGITGRTGVQEKGVKVCRFALEILCQP